MYVPSQKPRFADLMNKGGQQMGAPHAMGKSNPPQGLAAPPPMQAPRPPMQAPQTGGPTQAPPMLQSMTQQPNAFRDMVWNSANAFQSPQQRLEMAQRMGMANNNPMQQQPPIRQNPMVGGQFAPGQSAPHNYSTQPATPQQTRALQQQLAPPKPQVQAAQRPAVPKAW